MPITSRRARAGQTLVVRRTPDVATKRPKRPAAERTSLDVIAGPSILSAPSGKTYVTGRPGGGQRGYPRTPREWPVRHPRVVRRCGQDVENRLQATGQPPIANISIRGRLDVAPERIS